MKVIEIENEKDFEEFMKREDIPQDIKSDIEKEVKELWLHSKAKKLYTATERFGKNYEKTFEKHPSKFNKEQMVIYTKALNSCSQILEKLNKEMKIYE